MAVVTLDKIRKRYGSTAGPAAVDNVDITIGDREFMVLLGPSGCAIPPDLPVAGGAPARNPASRAGP